MFMHLSAFRFYSTSDLLRSRARRRILPRVEGLEDRTVLSTAVAAHEVHEAVLIHANVAKPGSHSHVAAAVADRDASTAISHHKVSTDAKAQVKVTHVDAKKHDHTKKPAGTTTNTSSTKSKKAHRHGHKHKKKGTATPTPTPAPTSTSTTSTSATPAATMAATSTPTPTPTSTSTGSDPTILTLSLNPIDLNLLGLQVELYGQTTTSPVTVTVSADSGNGDLLGNLLTDVGGLLNTQGVSTALDTVLNNVVSLVNQSTLSVNGQTSTATPTSTTPVLDAYIAPIQLDLLGAVVTTSPINLVIQANAGTGLALGNIVADLANILNGPTNKNVVGDIEQGLTNLLNTLDQQFPSIPSAPLPSSSPTSSSPGDLQVLSLTVPPIDLNLLGLILQTSTIQVNVSSQSGNGNLLGNLVNDLLSSVNATQSDINTINTDLNDLLAKVVGILNASSLSIPSGAVSSLSSTLQELASPTLIDTSGAAVSPQPVLNLNIASNNDTPPVDVDLLGIVVTTSNIQVQLLAQPGQGQILGNLVYNVSNLLDGGLLNVLGILDTLGV